MSLNITNGYEDNPDTIFSINKSDERNRLKKKKYHLNVYLLTEGDLFN